MECVRGFSTRVASQETIGDVLEVGARFMELTLRRRKLFSSEERENSLKEIVAPMGTVVLASLLLTSEVLHRKIGVPGAQDVYEWAEGLRQSLSQALPFVIIGCMGNCNENTVRSGSHDEFDDETFLQETVKGYREAVKSDMHSMIKPVSTSAQELYNAALRGDKETIQRISDELLHKTMEASEKLDKYSGSTTYFKGEILSNRRKKGKKKK